MTVATAPTCESHVVRRESPFLRFEVFGSVDGLTLKDVDFVVLEPGSAVVALSEWCAGQALATMPPPQATVEATVRATADWIHAQYKRHTELLASKRCGVDLAALWRVQGLEHETSTSYDVGTGHIVTRINIQLDEEGLEFVAGPSPRPPGTAPFMEIIRRSDTECVLHVHGPERLQGRCRALEQSIKVTAEPAMWVAPVHTVQCEIKEFVRQMLADVPTPRRLTDLLQEKFRGTSNPDGAGGFDIQCEVRGGLMLVHVPGTYPHLMPTGTIHSQGGDIPVMCPTSRVMRNTVQHIQALLPR